MLDHPFRVSLVGAGRVGTAVSLLLSERGHRVVAVWSRSSSRAEDAAVRLGAQVVATPLDAVRQGALILLGLSDDAIAPVVTEVSGALTPAKVVVHFAGSVGVDVLLNAAGWGGAGALALHPVQSVPDVDTGVDHLPGSAWGVTGSSDALAEWAQRLVRTELGGVPFLVDEGARPLWHAAAVTTSNATAAAIACGEALLRAVGIDDPSQVLGPLADGTVRNARERGPAATLTGPVVRGDVGTVGRHVAALRRDLPKLKDSYVLASRLILESARRAARIDEEVEEAVLRVLGR